MNSEAICENILYRLADLVDIERVILFGSRATGRNTDQSDWDFLVVGNSTIPFSARQSAALVALGPHAEPIDLLVYTPSEADEAASIPGTAIYWAEREGRVVFAK